MKKKMIPVLLASAMSVPHIVYASDNAASITDKNNGLAVEATKGADMPTDKADASSWTPQLRKEHTRNYAPLSAEAYEKIKKILGQLDTDARIAEVIDGPPNYVGLVLHSASKPSDPRVVIWATRNGELLFVGNLIDKTGRNLTDVTAFTFGASNPISLTVEEAIKTTMERLMPQMAKLEALRGAQAEQTHQPTIQQDPASMIKIKLKEEEMLDIAKNIQKTGRAIELSKGERKIYLFFDPQCPHCHRLAKDILSRKLDKEYSIVVIPVQAIGKQKPVVELLQVNSEEALRALLKTSTASAISSANLKAVRSKEEAMRILMQNNQDFEKIVTPKVTPFVLLHDTDGRVKHLIGGDANDIKRFFVVKK